MEDSGSSSGETERLKCVRNKNCPGRERDGERERVKC